MPELDARITAWTENLRIRRNLGADDVAELESHLRDEVESLVRDGLSEDEAFVVAIMRVGRTDAIAAEFAKVHTERLWKQLVLGPVDAAAAGRRRTEVWLVVALALVAGTFGEIPRLLGVPTDVVYVRNAGLFVFPAILAWFAWKRALRPATAAALFVPFAVAAIAVNAYPSVSPEHTAMLSGLHLPIALWLAVGIAYTGVRWGDPARRMDFVRFSGEAFIYGSLLLAGVGVLTAFTMAIFAAIGVDVEPLVQEWLMIYGLCAVPVVAAYLVEAKKSVIENMAPVLARIFAPLVLAVMAAVLGAMIVLGKSPLADRDFLIAFDLMLALVIGLVLYITSARDPDDPKGMMSVTTALLIGIALILDAVALAAVLGRIDRFGPTPNRVAALGENVVLLVHLAGMAYVFLQDRNTTGGYHALVRWQTGFVVVWAAWAAIVAFAFPPLFGYR